MTTPKEYFALRGDMTLLPLGICASFMEADEKADGEYVWMFDRNDLTGLRDEANRVLEDS
jgi:hypothetical protein